MWMVTGVFILFFIFLLPPLLTQTDGDKVVFNVTINILSSAAQICQD